MVDRLRRVSLREVWPHEALDFTRWLEQNYDVLGDVLGFDLASAEREQKAGTFSVDLLAEDEDGGLVVIENQLEKSNHDHLGKLITYLTSFDAKRAVWIVAEPQPEHVGAIAWLNESSSGDFYLLKVEAVRIGESEPAPLLTLITGPSDESKVVGQVKREVSGQQERRRRFWTSLLERAREKTRLHAGISPTVRSYVSTGAGRSGLRYVYFIRLHDAQVELFINRRKDGQAENKRIFDTLAESKSAIEGKFGGALDWQRLDAGNASRIRCVLDVGSYLDEDRWPDIQDMMIETMIRFERALKPFVNKLPM